MVVGFTGTRRGLTEAQAGVLRRLLVGVDEFVHGDCVGADEAARDIAHDVGVHRIISRPCTIRDMRAWTDCHVVHIAKPPLVRNRDIVDNVSRLIACPSHDQEEVRSGTWYTIRYARKRNKPIIIITPSGDTIGE